ncbi:hypothetical protein GCM10011512_13000 [Tersicoccus solisilvae]|uniref:FHA domain-containing protein n=1 Tax=Tersicoccus solisilvae TaxID=1882339 RepID=A0ABQ1NY18_9MICC|nr:FtsK/SpoIIIE domain-containing protein [Tersicoccus solisilvae]GGC87460.1 hypothetical protein GCM10011512_13000 [Tersicoccus solisilvae]
MMLPIVLVHGPGATTGPGPGPRCRCRTAVVHLVADLPDARSGDEAESDESVDVRRENHPHDAGERLRAGAGPGPILAGLLGRVCGHAELTVDGVPVSALRAVPVSGALIVRAGVAARRGGPPAGLRLRPASPFDLAAGLVLGVTGGAGAGTLLALHRGRHTIGRAGADLAIDDPSVSRRHAVLDVLPDRIVLTDTGSANGLTVDGRRRRTAVVTVDSRITVGAASLRLRATDTALPPYPTRRGSVTRPRAGTAAAPSAPALRRGPSWPLAAAALLPLLVGIVLGATTGSWVLLAMTAMSVPVTLLPALAALRARHRSRRPHRTDPGAPAGRPGVEHSEPPDLTVHLLAAHRSVAGVRGAPGGPPGPGTRASPPPDGPAGAETDLPPALLRLGAAVPSPGRGRLRYPGGAVTTCDGDAVTGRPAPAGTTGGAAGTAPGNAPTAPDPRSREPRWAARRSRVGRGGEAGTRLPGPPPVVLELAAHRRVDIVGGRAETAGLVRALVTQVSGLDPAVRLHLCADPELAASARLLPSVTVLGSDLRPVVTAAGSRRPGAVSDPADDAESPDEPAAVLVVAVDRLDAAGRAALGRVLRHPPPALWLVREPEAPGRAPTSADGDDMTVVRLGSPATIRAPGTALTFAPDEMPAAAFERYCVWRTQALPARILTGSAADLPRRCTSDALLRLTREAVAAARLPCVLGVTADGPLLIDLAVDGPHLLVAGTTGAGKSELLRTLILSLTRHRSPDALGLVLIDFKGGTALAPLATLPHCDALITDLDDELERTLASLRAELRRREELLRHWAADAVDDAAIPAQESPGRLVIVIDEFRVMADEHPDGLAELVRLAAQGRSLGIHLVMATQRPRGAVNGDIRANTAIRIALRTQSADESFDVIGSGLAAALPARIPGRGWIAVGDRPPVLFQTATAVPGTAAALPRIAPWDGAAGRPGPWTTAPISGRAGTTFDVRPRGPHDDPANQRSRRRVIAPPLPEHPCPADVLALAAPGTIPSPAGAPVGVIDRPDQQRLQPWWHRPGEDPHLAVLGEDGAAVGVVMRALVAATATGLRCYLLDASGALAGLLPATAVAARVTAAEPQRAARVLDHLARTVDAREGTADGAEFPEQADPGVPDPLLLVVHDWSVWTTVFRAQPWAGGEELVQRLAGAGRAARLGLIVSGGRDLSGGRLLACLGQRVHVPGDPTAAWPRLPRVPRVSGRVVLDGPAVQSDGSGQVLARAQLVLAPPAADGSRGDTPTADDPGRHSPRQDDPGADSPGRDRARSDGSAAGGAMAAPIRAPGSAGTAGSASAGSAGTPDDDVRAGPVLSPLPDRLSLDRLRGWAAPGPSDLAPGSSPRACGPGCAPAVTGTGWALLAGLGEEHGRPLWLRLRPGQVLPVIGASGSGRSTVLRALAALNVDAVSRWSPGDAAPPGPRVHLVDDADALDPTNLARLTELLTDGHAAVVAVSTATALTHRFPLIGTAVTERRLVVVGVADPAALIPLGVRLPVDPITVRGRSVHVHGPIRRVFQVPEVPEVPDTGPGPGAGADVSRRRGPAW